MKELCGVGDGGIVVVGRWRDCVGLGDVVIVWGGGWRNSGSGEMEGLGCGNCVGWVG